MKNTSVKQIWNLILTIGLCTSATGFAGNADGHNGPTLSPISVPGTEEHGVNEEAVKKALKVCFVDGDPRRGVKSLLQRTMERASGLPFVSYGDQHSDKTWSISTVESKPDYSGGCPSFSKTCRPQESEVTLTRSSETSIQSSHRLAYDPKVAALFVYNRNTPGGFKSWGFWLPAEIYLPEVQFESRHPVSDLPDEFGAPTRTRYYLKGLRIATYATGEVPLWVDRKWKSSLTVDLDAYADCLVNEIQRDVAK